MHLLTGIEKLVRKEKNFVIFEIKLIKELLVLVLLSIISFVRMLFMFYYNYQLLLLGAARE